MAFNKANLSQLAHGNNFKLWVYTSGDDAIAAIRASGYFNDAANMPDVRDLVIVADTPTPTTQLCTVLWTTGIVVCISDGTAISETDTG